MDEAETCVFNSNLKTYNTNKSEEVKERGSCVCVCVCVCGGGVINISLSLI